MNHDRLEPGECLVAFTDGVTDAMNTDGTMLGPERLVNGCKCDVPGGRLFARLRLCSRSSRNLRGAPRRPTTSPC